MQDICNGWRWRSNHDQIRHRWQIIDCPIALLARHTAVLRVDRVQDTVMRALEAVVLHIFEYKTSQRALALGGTDYRHATRRQK